MRYLVVILLIVICIGCSNQSISEEMEITQIEPDRVYDISFKEKTGRATIIYDKSRGIDFVVWMKDIDPNEGYEIFIRNDGGGVVFGPEGNLNIKIGTIEGETLLHPNHNGELYVSMLNPERLFTGADQVRIEIMNIDQKVVSESLPFKF